MATPALNRIIPTLKNRKAEPPLWGELELEILPMIWTRADTLGVSDKHCTLCLGLGLRGGRFDATDPCNCVLRAIFRTCFNRFEACCTRDRSLSRVSYSSSKTGRKPCWGRKDEEFMADFLLVSKRTLNAKDHKLFRYHFLLGAEWKQCCQRLGIEKGQFFHAVYRIEAKLGRVFRELVPYALYPLDEYFSGTTLDTQQIRRMRRRETLSKDKTEFKADES